MLRRMWLPIVWDIGDAIQANYHCSSLPRFTGDGDCAPGFFNCGFADSEAEASAAGGTSAGRVGAIEPIKDMGEIDRIDAFAVILHADFYRVFRMGRANFDL